MLAEMIICGFHINVAKSSVLPRRRIQTLGVIADTIDMSFSLPSLRAHNCQRTSFSMSFARQEILVGVADTVGSAILGLCIFYIGWSRHRSWLRSGGAIVGGLRDTYRV